MNDVAAKCTGGDWRGDVRTAELWAKWASRVWTRRYKHWQSRNGQDDYYRERLVIPAILQTIEERVGGQVAVLADLGAGDGYTTARLSALLRDRGLHVGRLVMIDRSRRQLEAARSRPELRQSQLCSCNLLSDTARSMLHRLIGTSHPSIVTAVFLLQELPDLTVILSSVASILRGQGLFLAVIVAPDFAEELRRRGSVTLLQENSSPLFDWSWVGLYPIAIPSGVLRLPHFQRTRARFRQLFTEAGLRIVDVEELSLPDDGEARRIFAPTIYGSAILGRPSSLLITATPERHRLATQGSRHGA